MSDLFCSDPWRCRGAAVTTWVSVGVGSVSPLRVEGPRTVERIGSLDNAVAGNTRGMVVLAHARETNLRKTTSSSLDLGGVIPTGTH